MRKNGRRDKGFKESSFVCTHCIADMCDECTDILRVIANLPEICKCTAPGHSGEPALQQVRDPFSGDVHAPGLVVKNDGEIIRKHAFDPGYSGMSKTCNQLVMRNDYGDDCNLPREDPIHE